MSNHETYTLPSSTVCHVFRVPNPKASLILQHGFAECTERYISSHSALIPTLNSHSYTVYAMDLQGHGRSPGVRCVTDIDAAIVDHVNQRERVLLEAKSSSASSSPSAHPIFLLSHSLGGLITAGSVLSSPANVSGVILLSPSLPKVPLPMPIRLIVSSGAYLTPEWSIPIPRRPASELTRILSQRELDAKDPFLQDRQVPFRLASTALAVAERALGEKSLQRWEVPTLCMHGTADTYADFKSTEQFIGKIASRDKQFRAWEGGYHELLNDSEKEEVLQAILTWLEERLAQGGTVNDEEA